MKTTEPKTKREISGFDIVALMSTPFAAAIIIALFYVNVMYFLFGYQYIMPFILLYLVSFFETLFSALMYWKKVSLIKKISHGTVILIVMNLWIGNLEYFKSQEMLTAVLRDDLFHYTLVLRENGSCETETTGMLGFSEEIEGSYTLKGDTVIFKTLPYDNESFIPDTLLIDRKAAAVYIQRDENGHFIESKAWLSYFEIVEVADN